MIRILIALIIGFAAILWLPLWAQFSIFFILIIITPYQFLLLLPAMVADALYAPVGTGFMYAKYTIFVSVLLVIHWAIVSKTRVKDIYVLEEK